MIAQIWFTSAQILPIKLRCKVLPQQYIFTDRMTGWSGQFRCRCQNSEEDTPTAVSSSPRAAAASRQQVFQSCSVVSAGLLAGATALRFAAPTSKLFFKQNTEAIQPLLQGVALNVSLSTCNR